MSKKVLITGGSGEIGFALVNKFIVLMDIMFLQLQEAPINCTTCRTLKV